MVEFMPKFTPSADLLKQGAEAATAQAKKLKIDVPKPAVESSASSVVPPASEPAVVTPEQQSIASAEKAERERQITDVLLEMKEKWIARIRGAKTKDNFSVISTEAGKNGKYSSGAAPGFVVGNFLNKLFDKYPAFSDKEKEHLRDKAWEMQREIEPVYLEKQGELYPSRKAAIPVVESEAPAKQNEQKAKTLRRRQNAKTPSPKAEDVSANQASHTANEDQEKQVRTEQVSSVKSFEGLYKVLEGFDRIPTSNIEQQTYGGVKQKIEDEKVGVDIAVEAFIKDGGKKRLMVSSRTPRAYGIRAKVDELLDELFEEKLQERKAVAAAPFEEPSWVDLVKDDKSTITVDRPVSVQGTAAPEAAVEPMPTPQAAPEVVAKETTPGNFEIKEGRYRAVSNGVVRTISKEIKKNGKEIYYETFETGEITKYTSLKALNKVAEKEGWQPESDAVPQAGTQVEQAAFPEEAEVSHSPETVPVVSSPEASENKFSELEKNLEEARQRYAKNDFENTSTLRKLSAFFRLDKTTYEGLDVDGTKEEYDKAFQALLNARLADIHQRKDAGEINDEQYKLEMGQTLTSFECEGRIKIFQARQQVKMESLAQSKIGWLIEGIPRLAHAYNKLPKSARFAIGAALGIGALVAGPGAGVAATATWIALARGTISGMGTFAMVDSTLDAISDARAGKAAEKSGSKMFTEYEDLLAPESRTAGEIVAAKEQFIREKLEKLHGHFEDRKRGMVMRKSAAVLAGVAFGTAVGSGWLGEKIKGLFGTGEVPSAPIEAHQGDSTWKLLNQYLSAKDSHFSGMNEAQKTYAIDALKDKLAAMSSKDLIEGGFKSGDISKLGIGEHIDFDKLVGGSITEAMRGASGLSTGAVESITQNNADILKWARLHPDVKLTDAVVDNILHGNAVDVVSGSPTVIDAQMQKDLPLGQGLKMPAGIPKIADAPPVPLDEVVVSAQEAAPAFAAELQPRVDDWYMQIFRVENARSGQDWVFDKAAIAKVQVLDIVKDARLLQQGSFSGYVTGLNSEQVRNFAEFSQNVAKSNIGFDGAAFFRENPGATVMDYLKKVAPLVQQGQRLGLYTATH